MLHSPQLYYTKKIYNLILRYVFSSDSATSESEEEIEESSDSEPEIKPAKKKGPKVSISQADTFTIESSSEESEIEIPDEPHNHDFIFDVQQLTKGKMLIFI